MVLDILGVINDVPEPNDVPPVDAAYQLMVPDDAVAAKLTVPVEHLAAGVVAEIDGIVLTVASTLDLVAVVQPLAVAST